MITIGKTYKLKALKKLDFGVYLDAEDLYEVLLPKKYVPRDLEMGDEIEVFLYLDSEDRPVATTLKPKAQLGEFAYLTVIDVNNTGAFLDWGLEKISLFLLANNTELWKSGALISYICILIN